MKVERPNSPDLTPEDLAHLEELRELVSHAIANGRLSQDEMQDIQSLIHADHKVTYEELRIVNQTIREFLGDAVLEYDWD
jgi:GAF domain-containing protein